MKQSSLKWLTIDFKDDDILLPLQINKISSKLESAKYPELDRNDTITENIYELEDLLPMYPDQDIPNIQTYITSKKEFNEKGASTKESLPKKGNFLRHQEFIHRFLYHYKKLFIMHRPGTGKTGATGGFTEKIKHNLQINKTLDFVDVFFNEHRSSMKKTFILVSNSLLQTEFKTQIVYRYSAPGDYDIASLNQKDEISSKNRIIGKMLKNFYKIMTYTKIANIIIELGYNPQIPLSEVDPKVIKKLNNFFKDSIIVIDEAHNIRVESPEGENPIKIKKGAQRSKAITYRCIEALFYFVKSITKIIMTATPMINDASEFIDMINLFLEPEKQMPNSKEDRMNFTNLTIKELEPYFRGKISYVRESGSFVDKKYMGVHIMDAKDPNKILEYKINGKTYKSGQLIYSLYMSTGLVDENNNPVKILDSYGYPTDEILRTQGEIYAENYKESYLDIKNININDDELEQAIAFEELYEDTEKITQGDTSESLKEDVSDVGSNFFRRVGKFRQISNGIFPDGSYGHKGFNKYIKEDKFTKEYQAIPELLSNISNIDYLEVLNIKAYTIINIIKEKSNNTIKGPMYSYTHLKTGSGAIYLGICLGAHGFEKFTGKESALKRKIDPSKFNPACTPAMEDQYCDPKELEKVNNEQELKEDFPKKLRYAILTSGINENNRNNILALYNSPSNIDGEYIKFLIITPVGREGINLSNSAEFVLIDPSWNPSSKFQAESRGFRETGHYEKIKQLLKLGIDKLSIELYNFAAYTLDSNGQTISIEKDLYMLSERKDIEIKISERNAKILAVDAEIHKERNQRSSDIGKEYTSDCDYDVCFYDTYDPLPPVNYIDYTTYDIYYSDDIINKIIDEIKDIFSTIYSININNIITKLHLYRHKLILKAIAKMIGERIKLSNRLGYDCYLLEDQGMLFTQKEYPVTTTNNYQKQYNLNYYSKYLILPNDKRLEDYISDDQLISKDIILKNLELNIITHGIDNNINNIEDMLLDLSLINKIKLFEDAVINTYINQLNKSIDNYIINKFSSSFIHIKEPVKDILKYSQILANTVKGKPGRKPLSSKLYPTSGPDVSPYKVKLPESNSEGDDVYVHILYGDLKEIAAIAKISSFNKAEGLIRILRPSDGAWRDANESETLVYKNIYINQRGTEISSFIKHGIHGKILGDGKLRIVNIEPGETHIDNRKSKNGRICTTMHKDVLTDIMYRLNVPLDKNIGSDILLPSVSEMKELIIQTFTNNITDIDIKKLSYYYKVIKSRATVITLCKYIRSTLENNNLIYYA